MKKSKNGFFPEIHTERLYLRKISLKDAKTLFQYWSDPKVTKYLNITTFKNIEQSYIMIRLLSSLYRTKKGIRWTIVTKDTKDVIGTCGFNNWVKKSSRGEIGYELGKEYWGKGYASEAVKEILKYGFKTMNLNRIEAFTVPEATSSINLLEKLGFKKEGLLRDYGFWNGKYWDENIYSLLRKDWIKNI
jgi:ribosomal-protein-alanine N-acetyltransferase